MKRHIDWFGDDIGLLLYESKLIDKSVIKKIQPDTSAVSRYIKDVILTPQEWEWFLEHNRLNKQKQQKPSHLKQANAKFHKYYKRMIRTGSACVQMSFDYVLINYRRYKIDEVYDQMTEADAALSRSYIAKHTRGDKHSITNDERVAYRTYNRLRAQTDDGKASFRKWLSSPNGKKYKMAHNNSGDLDLVWDECGGRCLYTGIHLERSVRMAGKHCADCDHIDASLKGTKDDGPHNWTLASSNINSSKGNKCLYEWHSMNKDILGLRPLNDILTDLARMGKRIPPAKKFPNHPKPPLQ